jgi:thiamine monophosphate synthase
MAPAGFLIGASFGSESERANAEGADYVGIGPVFGTLSKSDAGEALRAGAAGVAVIRAVLGAADPERAARELRAAVDGRA